MPVLFLLLVAYSIFHESKSRTSFIGLLVCIITLLHLYLVMAYTVLAFVVTFLIFDFAWIKKNSIFFSDASLSAIAICFP